MFALRGWDPRIRLSFEHAKKLGERSLAIERMENGKVRPRERGQKGVVGIEPVLDLKSIRQKNAKVVRPVHYTQKEEYQTTQTETLHGAKAPLTLKHGRGPPPLEEYESEANTPHLGSGDLWAVESNLLELEARVRCLRIQN